MYSTAYVWAKVLGHMEARLTPQVVSTWFDDTEILELTDQKLVLYSPSTFRKDIILRRCTGYIKEAMQEIFQMNVEVEVLDETEIEAYRGRSQKPEFIEFNPQFTFDNFVVGSSNRFAHAAAVSVANNPAETYNPLFIYGPSGLGKTHLLYAIASVVHKNHPSYNIVYIKGDQFTNELIAALQEGRNNEFRNKYRNADLFLVDDIQFIAGKESTQEEFFHTFNNLYENHHQIVLTAILILLLANNICIQCRIFHNIHNCCNITISSEKRILDFCFPLLNFIICHSIFFFICKRIIFSCRISII